jgi:PKD repeat protein
VHAAQSRMATRTFQPLVGKTSETDVNNITTYYEYDDAHRLHLVRDDKGNILKRYTYHAASTPSTPILTLEGGGGVIAGTPAQFLADVEACGSVKYYWNFGDGTTYPDTSTPNPEHTYYNNGTYTVTVVAESPDSSPIERSVTVNVGEELSMRLYDVGPTDADCGTPYNQRLTTITPQTTGGCAGYTYTWEESRDGSAWTGCGNATVNSNGVLEYRFQYEGSITFRCTVTDGCGHTYTDYSFSYTTTGCY